MLHEKNVKKRKHSRFKQPSWPLEDRFLSFWGVSALWFEPTCPESSYPNRRVTLLFNSVLFQIRDEHNGMLNKASLCVSARRILLSTLHLYHGCPPLGL